MRESWVDHQGNVWPILQSRRPLRFKNPAHAALRAFVFHRDGYQCRRCKAKAVGVPEHYSGRYALYTDTRTGSGTQDVLVLDHILTLRAEGLSVPGNLQSLCETCNRRKQREDKAAALIAVERRA